MADFETETFLKNFVGVAQFSAMASESLGTESGEFVVTTKGFAFGNGRFSLELSGGRNLVDWESIVKVTSRPEDDFVVVEKNTSRLRSARAIALVTDCGAKSSLSLIASYTRE